MKYVALVLILVSLSLSAFATSNGVIITYLPAEAKKLPAIHKNVNTKIFYQAKKLPQQVIHSKNKALNFNENYLRTLCKIYLEYEFITKCELNEQVKAREEGLNCRSDEAATLTELRGIGSFFSQLGKSGPKCSLSNPQNYPDLRSNGGGTRLVGGFYNDQLTPRWAQEYIGADLAYSYMLEKKANEKLSVKDGVIDTGFDFESLKKYPVLSNAKNPEQSKIEDPRTDKEKDSSKAHGNAVVSLMIHPSYGVSPVAELSLVKEAVWSSSIIEGVDLAISNGTQIINMSTNTPISTVPILKEANKKNIIIVTAAGNDFNDGKKQVDFQYDLYEQILVGSLAPQGYVSVFSQQGKAVTILAPSDYWVAAEDRGKEISFGGTSGASPLVKGSLDNVLALVPNLNTKQIKILLEKTAIQTISTETKNHQLYHNGAGMINSYKLAVVASRLKEQLKDVKSTKRQEKIEEFLQSTELYQFDQEASLALKDGFEKMKSEDCATKQEGFRLVRISYFLNMNEDARKKIVATYKDEDKDVNAEFFESIASDRAHYVSTMSRELFKQHILHYPETTKK